MGVISNVANITLKRSASITLTQTGSTDGDNAGIYRLSALLAYNTSKVLFTGAPLAIINQVVLRGSSTISGPAVNLTASTLSVLEQSTISSDLQGYSGSSSTSSAGKGPGAGLFVGSTCGGKISFSLIVQRHF